MKNYFEQCGRAFVLGFLAISMNFAQSAETPHVNVPVMEANAADVSSIEAIVRASYETISGGVRVPRQWGRDRTLYDPHARFVAIEQDKKTGTLAPQGSTEQEFADESDAFMVKDGFTERELGREIHRFGNVVTVLSSYEGKAASTGKVVTRGVNIFQLYYDGKRWWILSIVWDEERPGNRIPGNLVPKGPT